MIPIAVRPHTASSTVPKSGNGAAENEDAVQVSPSAGRFAVSDGASSSARSDVWSTILTEVFVTEAVDPLAPDVLPRLRRRWWDSVNGGALPWYAQEKLLQGASATFAGLVVGEDWYEVQALGDSCFFHLRGGELLLAGPLERSSEFSRFPELVTTNNLGEPPAPWRAIRRHKPGDVLVLTTDALAKYLLGEYESTAAFDLPAVAGNSDHFPTFVTEARANGMPNDDATLCVVRT